MMCETVPQATPRQTQEVVVGWVVYWPVSMLTEVNLFHNECSDAMFFCSHVSFSIDNEDISVWSVSDQEITAIENIVVT